MANALIITSAGLDKMVRADQSGTDAVRITACRFGSGQWTPTQDATALLEPFDWTLSTIAGGAVAGNQIHIEVTDGSDRIYTAYEVGLYDSDGDLLALASQATPLLSKAAASTAMITFDIALENLDVEDITFGDTTYVNPSATETKEGVAEIATQAEVDAGTDDHRFVTPKKLAAWIVSKLQPYLKTSQLLDKTWPVGSIYMSVNATSPATLFGGTWTRLQDCFLYAGTGSGDYAPGKTGGAKTVTLGEANMPAHSHTVTCSDAGAKAASTVTSTASGSIAKQTIASTDAGAKSASTVTSTNAGAVAKQTITSTEQGGHTPSGTISGGGHAHSGSTGTVSAHTHGPGTYEINGKVSAAALFDADQGQLYSSGALGFFTTSNAKGDADKSGTNNIGLELHATKDSGWSGASASAGGHSHTVTINSATPSMTFKGTAVAAHSHNVTVPAVAAHSHSVTVPAIAAHSHNITIPAVAAHSHSVTVPAITAHSHSMTCGSKGSGTAVNKMPPFLAVYMWKRTA